MALGLRSGRYRSGCTPRLAPSAAAGDINPQAYLTEILARIVLRDDAGPIDDLLPYNWVDSRAAASAVIDQAA
ncbi:transposase domain-containing protein [Sphingobium sp. AN558]|uniref:transposase domain-containing protein n=1 Tax=Sphingobium sp. AN558 TaxID=3133442 RepID=UPI0030BE3E53